MSAIALSIGEERAELGAEAMYEPGPPLVRPFLRLGVRGRGSPTRFAGRIGVSPDFLAENPVVSVVGDKEEPGMSVRRGERPDMGLGRVPDMSELCEIEEVLRAERGLISFVFVEVFGGGEGATVFD
jgi:hypothetical protein